MAKDFSEAPENNESICNDSSESDTLIHQLKKAEDIDDFDRHLSGEREANDSEHITDSLLTNSPCNTNETDLKDDASDDNLTSVNIYASGSDENENPSRDALINGKTDVDIEMASVHATADDKPERETWGKKADFLLSIIGFAVDLGNVWRFPYICYKNGGGAFLIPYFVMLVFLGLPLFYMELALGQFHKSGAIAIWGKLCPMFTGVGFGIILVAAYVGMYYNTIIAWALYYLVNTFRSKLPWASCNNSWNTPDCISIAEGYNGSSLINNSVPSALEYFRYKVLESHRSTGIDDIGAIKWDLCLCLLGVMAVVYFALWKGVKSSGKAVWVTATVPYVVLLVLLVRGVTLPGAARGILYYVTPVWDRLFDVGVWIDAAAQIFFSLGPGFGTLLALSSYNTINNNCYRDAMMVASINCLTSLMAGFVVFSVLGYMSHVLHIEVERLAVQGPGLVFYVYPEAISTLDGSIFWAIIFFLLLITLGVDSTFGGIESIITAICDLSPKLARRRELIVLAVVIVCFLGGLPTTTYGGQYVITLMDTHAAPVALIFICFIEVIAVNWFYGVHRFSDDIEKMLGFQPGLYWKVCWVAICPLFLFILFILSIVAYEGLSIEGYQFPAWSETIGWMLTASSLVCIPAYLLFAFITTPGPTIEQKLRRMIRPKTDGDHPYQSRYTGFVVGIKTLYHNLSNELTVHNPFYKHNERKASDVILSGGNHGNGDVTEYLSNGTACNGYLINNVSYDDGKNTCVPKVNHTDADLCSSECSLLHHKYEAIESLHCEDSNNGTCEMVQIAGDGDGKASYTHDNGVKNQHTSHRPMYANESGHILDIGATKDRTSRPSECGLPVMPPPAYETCVNTHFNTDHSN